MNNDEDEISELSYNDKLKFSNSLRNLSEEQLGQVVKLVSETCPESFKEVDSEKYQILVDNLSYDTFKSLIKLYFFRNNLLNFF